MLLRLILSYLVLPVILMLGASAAAEQASNFDDYVVYYNALTTDQIEPSIARPYGILRSKSRALINISVQQKVMGTSGQPVAADVKVTATNLSAQLKHVDMRQITSGGEGATAIYYIGELPVAHKESITFDVEVTPEGSDKTHKFSFNERFFTR